MDAPLADILLLSLALVTFAGLIALAKVFEKVTAESAKTARITDPSDPDTRGGAQA